MTRRQMIEEALGLTKKRNNRWRSIWRVAGPEARARYRVIFQRELNKIYQKAYEGVVERMLYGDAPPLFRHIPKQPAFAGERLRQPVNILRTLIQPKTPYIGQNANECDT